MTEVQAILQGSWRIPTPVWSPGRHWTQSRNSLRGRAFKSHRVSEMRRRPCIACELLGEIHPKPSPLKLRRASASWKQDVLKIQGTRDTKHMKRFCHFPRKHCVHLVMFTGTEQPQFCEESYSPSGHLSTRPCNIPGSLFLYLKPQPCSTWFYLSHIRYLIWFS